MGEMETANMGTDDDTQVFPGERLNVMENAAILGLSGRSCSQASLLYNLPFGAQSERSLQLEKSMTLAREATFACSSLSSPLL